MRNTKPPPGPTSPSTQGPPAAHDESLAQVILRPHVQPPVPLLAHCSHVGYQLESAPQLACHGVSPTCAVHASVWLARPYDWYCTESAEATFAPNNMPATATNTDKVARNLLERTGFTTDLVASNHWGLHSVRKSSHRARNEVQVHARALRRGNGKDNQHEHRRKSDPGTRNRALGTRFMCTECAQTLQNQSQLRGIHKTVTLTVHDRKDLFIRFAPI